MSRLVIALVPATVLGSYPLVYASWGGGEWPFSLLMPWAAMFLVIWLWQIARARQTPCGQGCLGILSAMYFAAAAASALFANQKAFCATALAGLGGNLLLAYAVAVSFDPKKNLPLLTVWMGVATLVSLWAVATYLRAAGAGAEVATAPSVTFGNRNFLAGFLAASVFACAGFACRRSDDARWEGRRVLYLFWAAFLLAVIVAACRSRGALLAMAMAGFALLLGRVRNWLIRFALVVGAALAMLIAREILPVKARLLHLIQSDVRPAIWAGAWQMIWERPWLGHGWGSFVTEYPPYRPLRYWTLPTAASLTNHAHNELLEIAAEGGLISLAVFLGLVGFVLWRGARAARDDPAAAGLTGALGLLLIHNMVDVNLRHAPNQTLFWILMGLILAQRRGEPDAPSLAQAGRQAVRFWVRAGAGVGGVLVAVFAVARPLWADAQYSCALRAADRGDWPRAVAAYEKSLVVWPQRLEGWYRLGFAYAQIGLAHGQSGEHEQAVKALLRAREAYARLRRVAPDYAEVNLNAGMIEMSLSRPARAVDLFERAARSNPYDARAVQWLARARMAAEQ